MTGKLPFTLRSVRASTRSARTLLLFFLPLALLFCSPVSGDEAKHPVLILQVRGTVNPAVARYVARGLEEARRQQATALVIQIDTPGGLDGSMRGIIQGILDSPVPVIVYVSPAGARAASAGAFIAVSAHVAAMAPSTNIGAAHPVQIGGGGAEQQPRKEGEKPSAMEDKLTNDAVAYIRSIAEERGRNLEWVEAAVRQSRSSSAEEAVQQKVVDFIAKDVEELLRQADGRQVKTVVGTVTLDFAARPKRLLPMTAMESALQQIAHPNLAYILMLLGIYGLIYELATPGAVFPGVLGSICLVLSLIALETLEVNWGGIALIALSLLFFIADVKLPGYGALTIGGIIAFALGSLLLFPGARIPGLRLPWGSIAAATGATAAFFLLIVSAGIRALKQKVTSGAQSVIGAVGEAKTELSPGGVVLVKGEEWQARSEERIHKGDRVRVVKLEGLTVWVERAGSR